jgi:hypothetical protein
MSGFGAFSFGLLLGWITYRTLRRRAIAATSKDIGIVVGSLGSGGLAVKFAAQGEFELYSLGLATGFFAYFLVSLFIDGLGGTGMWFQDLFNSDF